MYLRYLRAFITYKSVVMYSCISEHSELTSQWLCTHASQGIDNEQVSGYVLMYLRAVRTYKSLYSCIIRAFRTYKSVVRACTHVSLRAVRTYKSVVMYSYISRVVMYSYNLLTGQQLCTHVSQSIQNLQVSIYVRMHLRALRTNKSVVMYSCISEQSELTSQ